MTLQNQRRHSRFPRYVVLSGDHIRFNSFRTLQFPRFDLGGTGTAQVMAWQPVRCEHTAREDASTERARRSRRVMIVSRRKVRSLCLSHTLASVQFRTATVPTRSWTPTSKRASSVLRAAVPRSSKRRDGTAASRISARTVNAVGKYVRLHREWIWTVAGWPLQSVRTAKRSTSVPAAGDAAASGRRHVRESFRGRIADPSAP